MAWFFAQPASVLRTKVRSLKCLAAALQKCPMMSKFELVGPRLSDWGNKKGVKLLKVRWLVGYATLSMG